MPKPRVLFVDDDPVMLKGLRLNLKPLSAAWEMSFVQGGPEALARLAQDRSDVIIADMAMTSMTGAELLGIIVKRYPEVLRFGVIGQATDTALSRSQDQAHQYFSKPLDVKVVKERVERALALHQLLAGHNLKSLISQVRVLPGLPDLYLELTAELQAPDASMKRVGELIEREPGLGAKVLKLVNSAYYGLPHQVASPAHAARLLGLEVLQSLILLQDIFTHYDRIRGMVPQFSLEVLQQHSLAVSAHARAIARRQRIEQHNVDDIAIAGLLHDIGKLVLLANFPGNYQEIMNYAQAKRAPIWKAEWAILGATHAQVGAYLLGLWGLATPIVEAVAFHHEPRTNPHQGFTPVTAVHAADALTHEVAATSPDFSPGKLEMQYLKEQHLDACADDWRTLCGNVPVSKPAAPAVVSTIPVSSQEHATVFTTSHPAKRTFWQRFLDWLREAWNK